MKKIGLVVALLALVLGGCSNNQNKENDNQNENKENVKITLKRIVKQYMKLVMLCLLKILFIMV